MRHRELTPDELDALKAFAKEKGRRWKSELAEVYWPNARVWEEWSGMQCSKDKGYLLHGLRNSHGPSWVSGFKLPK